MMRSHALLLTRKPAASQFSLMWLVAVILPLANVQGKPILVPSWAESMQKNPPPVSPEIVSEVDDLWAVLQKEKEGNRTTGADHVKAVRRFVELKDQASQAMLWQYFKCSTTSSGLYPLDLMNELKYDPDLSRWFLPLFRDRMKWAEQEVSHGRFLDSIGYPELAAINTYFYFQGTLADMEAFERLISRAEQAGLYRRARGYDLMLDLNYLKTARKQLRVHARPFWQTIAIFGLPEKTQFEKVKYALVDSDPVSESLNLQAIQTRFFGSEKVQSIATQIILGGLALLASLLLVVAFKRRREAG